MLLAAAGGAIFAMLAYAPPAASSDKNKFTPLTPTAERPGIVTEDAAWPRLDATRSERPDAGLVAAAQRSPADRPRTTFEGRTTPTVGGSLTLSALDESEADGANLTAEPHSRGPP